MEKQSSFDQRVRDFLEARRREGILLAPPPPPEQNTVDFGSNDILSLSSSGILRKAFLQELSRHPDFQTASPGGRIGGGPTAYLLELEDSLAKVHEAESATYFNSGFEANVAIWSALPKAGDVIVHDEDVHASTYEGMRRGRASARLPFTHNDCDSFRDTLQSARARFPDLESGKSLVFFAVESFYSITGDVVPIHRLLLAAEELLPRKNFVFVIDEAHSNGLLGPQGAGFISFWGLEGEMAIRVHTFGKAPGVTGAVVLASKDVKLMLLNLSRNIIFSTGPTFPALAALQASYSLIRDQEGEKRRAILQSNIAYLFRTLEAHLRYRDLERLGVLQVPLLRDWDARPFQTPIVVVYTEEGQSKSLAAELGRRKYRVQQGGYPFVRRGLEGVRIMVHAGNTEKEIEGLLQTMISWAEIRAKGAVMIKSKL